jgi:hypothetical protein
MPAIRRGRICQDRGGAAQRHRMPLWCKTRWRGGKADYEAGGSIRGGRRAGRGVGMGDGYRVWGRADVRAVRGLISGRDGGRKVGGGVLAARELRWGAWVYPWDEESGGDIGIGSRGSGDRGLGIGDADELRATFSCDSRLPQSGCLSSSRPSTFDLQTFDSRNKEAGKFPGPPGFQLGSALKKSHVKGMLLPACGTFPIRARSTLRKNRPPPRCVLKTVAGVAAGDWLGAQSTRAARSSWMPPGASPAAPRACWGGASRSPRTSAIQACRSALTTARRGRRD